jgi:hypothetical protein
MTDAILTNRQPLLQSPLTDARDAQGSYDNIASSVDETKHGRGGDRQP